MVPRSLGGDDVADNLVPLCGTGTTGCHGLVEARNPVACGMLRDSLSVLELQYVVFRKSLAFLDSYYPQDSGRDSADPGVASETASSPVTVEPARPDQCPTCGHMPRASRKPREPTRKRVQFNIAVPKDERENGYEILSTLVEQARGELDRPEGCPPYFVLVEVLHFFLTTPKDKAA
jgi:hypothetical protein